MTRKYVKHLCVRILKLKFHDSNILLLLVLMTCASLLHMNKGQIREFLGYKLMTRPPPETLKRVKNMSQCLPKQNIAFLKTHKCASSAIQNILLRYGYTHNLNFAIPERANYFGNGTMPFAASMVERTPWYKLGVNIFAMHTKWHHEEIQKIMPEQTVYLSIVREPSDLFESLYNFVNFKNIYHKTIYKFVKRRYKSAERLRGYIGYNQMTWDFGLPLQQMNDKTAVSKMTTTSGKRFDLVMVAERMEESLVLMSHVLCWDLTDVLVLKINARNNKFKTSIYKKTKERLKQRLSSDYILYNHFVRKFDKMVDTYGRNRMKRDVEELRKATAELIKTCGFDQKKSDELKGGNKPLAKKVMGYESATGDEKCNLYSMAELTFIDMIRNRQKELLSKNF